MLRAQEPEILVIGPARAAEALYQEFGALVDADYMPGKTLLRDALCDRFGLSQLAAEELCDELEGAGLVRFVATPEGVGWNIHPDPETAAPDRMI
ncbi:hypothetical protein [Polyangium aurulentum]|uniref:hypothetical protein n=1 Tax=Polyangium aurulentum TaxID=2567896 RepID=UPI0010ADF3F1|nr:hypothetical protein [Polyangium aurulentum]UQA62440.1 hypothetical protein E8A73_019065 [Polyangium aurulentum]